MNFSIGQSPIEELNSFSTSIAVAVGKDFTKISTVDEEKCPFGRECINEITKLATNR